MSTPTTLELVRAHNRAERERRDKQGERDKFIREKMDAHRTAVTAEAEGIYSADIQALYTAENAAREAMILAKEADARAGIGGIMPVGTVLQEWTTRRTFGKEKPVYTKTGRTARYIGVTRETVLPANRTYSNPDVGEFILQVNKQDGTPGIAIITGYDRTNFYPEGSNPNMDGVKAPFDL